jgi:hypothetical protein
MNCDLKQSMTQKLSQKQFLFLIKWKIMMQRYREIIVMIHIQINITWTPQSKLQDKKT